MNPPPSKKAESPKTIQRLFSEWRALLALALCIAQASAAFAARSQSASNKPALSVAERTFIEDLSRRTFLYFQEYSNRETGLVLDRARADGSPHDELHRHVASIAATGFGLTGWCIAAEQGWVSKEEARNRIRNSLRFFWKHAFNQRGWFYHWMDVATGERLWNSEISSIDTALLLAGILTARQYFRGDREIVDLATKIYDRVDFQWMLNGDPLILSHGWKPETGFLEARWDHYCELGILYLLAIGSRTHPIPSESWYAWKRSSTTYRGLNYIDGEPLFVHQFSHAWIDFRGMKENRSSGVDYFANSIKATLAQRRFCLELSSEFPGYSTNVWGITASDSAKGYIAWGGPPRDPSVDGTVVPCAAAGSLMFTPEQSVAALMEMKARFAQVYGKYGFVDAFNPSNGWINPDVIGIDLGITLLSAANTTSGSVWLWFMRNFEIVQAMKSAGFVSYHADYRALTAESLRVIASNRLVDSSIRAKYKAARISVAQHQRLHEIRELGKSWRASSVGIGRG